MVEENDTGRSDPAEPSKPSSGRVRKRRRIKIRRRVRIKKKTSPKKKAKKLLEVVAWVLIIAAFIVTLVLVVLQLDLSSKHREKKRTARHDVREEMTPSAGEWSIYIKRNQNSIKII